MALRPRLSPGVPFVVVWTHSMGRYCGCQAADDGEREAHGWCETDRDLFDLPVGRGEGVQTAILADEHL